MNQTNTSSRGPVTAILDLFSSIWLGVVLMVAIFLYASIGSAVQPFNPWGLPSPREVFEKSEMEWFCWWPFNLMILLFCINLVVVTLRRIPLKITTLGVWMIHTGIIILAIGSVYYFARKIEGDAPVYRRKLTINVPGSDPATLIVRPDNKIEVPADGGAYSFAIDAIDPQWPVPGSDERSYRLALDVRTPTSRFTRTLVTGHPELTTDSTAATQSIEIKVPGAPKSTMMHVAPHTRTVAIGDTGRYEFHISEINPAWPLMSGEDRGKMTMSVMVAVQTPKEMFTRQLLLGYPQYTEDIIPGSGRAVKIIGRKLIDQKLELTLHENAATSGADTSAIQTTLEYEPQTHAFQVETAALYLRPRGAAADWHMRPIDGLPHFRDYVVSDDHVWSSGARVEERRLDIPLADADADDPLHGYTVEVDGYLRYAHLKHGWVDGGGQLYPVAGVRLSADGTHQDYELAALDDRQRASEDGRVMLLWAENAAQSSEIDDAATGVLAFSIPERDVRFEAPARISAAFIDIAGTDWAYRVNRRHDRAGNGMLSIAVVDIRTPEGVITRWAADDPSKSKDVSGVSAEGRHEFGPPDARVDVRYTPSPLSPLTVVAGPDTTPYLINIAGTGNPVRADLEVGQHVDLGPGVGLTLEYLYTHAFPELRPSVVPLHQRRREAGKNFSWIHVVASKGTWQHQLWIPFNNYALPNEQYAVPQKIGYDPRYITLPDGTELELMFSRKRVPLPTAVVLDDFQLLTHQGGLIGQNSNVRDYISMLRFKQADGSWSEPTRMSLNAPASRDGYWYFQSIWDAPTPSSAGMNFTGCGVGTRDGVYIQLVGTCIAIIGMVYAFYFKPLILRRRRLAVYADLQAAEGADATAPALEERMGAAVGIGANGNQEHSS